ncbi:unnamed protein product, partial [Mesorhabditis spiculigera]
RHLRQGAIVVIVSCSLIALVVVVAIIAIAIRCYMTRHQPSPPPPPRRSPTTARLLPDTPELCTVSTQPDVEMTRRTAEIGLQAVSEVRDVAVAFESRFGNCTSSLHFDCGANGSLCLHQSSLIDFDNVTMQCIHGGTSSRCLSLCQYFYPEEPRVCAPRLVSRQAGSSTARLSPNVDHTLSTDRSTELGKDYRGPTIYVLFFSVVHVALICGCVASYLIFWK